MKLNQKRCRCCGGSRFERCGYRNVNNFFGYFALHIKPTISYRGEGRVRNFLGNKAALSINQLLNYLLGKFFRVTNKIAYGACLDCNFISPWPELSDESLLDYYTFYLSGEYKQYRGKFDAGYALISKMHGSDDELEMRRKQNEDFIAPILEAYLINSNINKLRMLDYGGGAGQVAPSFEWIDVDLYDVGDRSIKSLSNKINKDIWKEAIENHKSSYDFVQLLHVIEHVGNPLNIIRSAMEFVKKDGLILVEVPWEMTNFDELSQGDTIFCDEHINKFCDISILFMMKSLGLKILSCEGGYIKHLHINLPLKVIRCIAQKATQP
jgi:hypothetical protein